MTGCSKPGGRADRAMATVEEAVADDMRSDARWIFHIGHVGSTLVSRLLGELAWRPRDSRAAAAARSRARCPPEVRAALHRRSPEAHVANLRRRIEIACVKATSFASEIAPDLVPAGERALFMYATPRNYIASILAGENSVKELRMLAATSAGSDGRAGQRAIDPKLRTMRTGRPPPGRAR